MPKDILAQWGHLHRKLAGIADDLPAGPAHAAWTPNADVYDGPDGVVIKTELAGVPVESLRIQLEPEALILEGVRRDPYCSNTAAGYRFRQMEIDYGPFRRVLPLPYPVDGGRAAAHFREGFLEIHLPRAPRSRRKTITVIVES